MSAIRLMWRLIAVAAVVLALWSCFSDVSAVSLSCSKTGEFSDRRPDVQCADSIYSVYGVWPLLWLGLLLATPPVLAAITMRWWVSGLAVVMFALLSFYGLAHIWSILWLFVAAVRLLVVSLFVAAAHLVAVLVNGPVQKKVS